MLRDGEVLATGPAGEDPRPHHVEIGAFRRTGDGFDRVGTVAVETSGPRTGVDDLPEADLLLLNDSDLTFAAVRTDEKSLRTLLESAGSLPDPVSRALAVATAWDMLLKGELSSDELFSCVLGVLETERSAGVVEPFLAMALRTADQWTPSVSVPAQLARLAAVAAELAEDPEHRAPALRTLAASAASDDHFALLDKAAAEDNDLAWRVLIRRAELDQHDPAAVEALLERDPDPDARVRALGVTAARPDDAAKAEVWAEIFEKRSVPVGSPLLELARCFWRPVQNGLMLPWTQRYLDEVARLAGGGGMLSIGSFMRATFPLTGDDAFLERARAIAAEEGVDPTLRSVLLTGADTLARVLRARG